MWIFGRHIQQFFVSPLLLLHNTAKCVCPHCKMYSPHFQNCKTSLQETTFLCHLTCSRLSCSGTALCNGDPHATKRFRNETNAIYCSFSLQPAVNWSTIGHLWLFCATVGGAPSYFQTYQNTEIQN